MTSRSLGGWVGRLIWEKVRNPCADRGDNERVDRRVVIPGFRAIAAHAWINVVTGKIAPLVIFLALFSSIGITPAVLAALAWSLGVVAYQRAKGHRIAGLVILSIVGNTAKTIVAIATGSIVAYFIQPTISTTLIGTAFLISVPMGLPLAERLVHDFCPLDDRTANEPALKAFFPKLSILWAATSLLNGAVTLHLLLTQSVASFVVIKAFLGPVTTGLTVVGGLWWFQRSMRRAGVDVVLARRVGDLHAGRPTEDELDLAVAETACIQPLRDLTSATTAGITSWRSPITA